MNTSVCKNPWCKATFYYKEEDMIISEDELKLPPPQCQKCKSFNDNLSYGVSWKEKKYEGSRMDGMPHEISIKVNRFF